MKLRKLTLTAVLTAAALVMFVLESQLPPLTAIPGIKPGLSNIFTLFAMQALGPGWALGVLLVRVTLGCVITGQGMALLYSLTVGPRRRSRHGLPPPPALSLWLSCKIRSQHR